MSMTTEFMQMLGSIAYPEVEIIFRNFKSANSVRSRIQLVEELSQKYPSVNAFVKRSYSLHDKELAKPLKNPTLSADSRNKGNGYYRKKLFTQAILHFNQSILSGEGESLALGYANRSVAFFDTGDWLHSLRDIQMALDNNYPKKLQYKLRERQANCWFLLEDKKQAVISYMLARDLLIAHSIEDQTRIANIVAKLNKLNDTKVDVGDSMTDIKWLEHEIMKKRNVPPVLNGETNPSIPCALSAVQIGSATGKGRCLLATKDIKIGTTLVVEKAFTSLLNDGYVETHCHDCLQWTPGPIPCLRCSHVGFCSTTCRDNAWASYHQHECGFVQLLQQVTKNEANLLSLRTVLMVDRNSLVRAQTKKNRLDVSYNPTNYDAVYRLVGNMSERTGDESLRRTLSAFYLIGVVKGRPDTELSLALLHLNPSFDCNFFSVNQMFLPSRRNDGGKPSKDAIGGTIQPFASLINHSCDPNVVILFYGNVLAVKAIRPIREGDEILSSYMVTYYDDPKSERQAKLSHSYVFDCSCTPCAQNWPQMGHLPKLTNKPQLLHAIRGDLKAFDDRQFTYSDNLDEIVEWAEKFVGHLNSLDADAEIRKPLREYCEIQKALILCYNLMASVGPVITKLTPSVGPQFSFHFSTA